MVSLCSSTSVIQARILVTVYISVVEMKRKGAGQNAFTHCKSHIWPQHRYAWFLGYFTLLELFYLFF